MLTRALLARLLRSSLRPTEYSFLRTARLREENLVYSFFIERRVLLDLRVVLRKHPLDLKAELVLVP